jgi:hypothetical protein
VIRETGWTWNEVRALKLRRLWLLFRCWYAGGDAGVIPPPPSSAEIAAALSRVPWRN